MITVTDIVKSFGDIKAVDGLSFTIKEGEIVGLLGPNGAGKTTTMRMLTGFLSPDSGKAEINGLDIASEPVKAQMNIGYLPENNPLYKEMLVKEILDLASDLRGLDEKEKKKSLDFAVEATGISQIYYRQISELSKGFKQRVGMAMALLHKPSVLVMDEPTEGLDPNQRTEIRQLIKKLAKNRTVLISTHVMQEAEAICSRLLIINKGKLVADGTPGKLAKLSGFTGGLLITVEGVNVSRLLKSVKGVEEVEVLETSAKKVAARLKLAKNVLVQPEISKLAAKNNWIIWKMAEEKQNLEEIFHILTREEEK